MVTDADGSALASDRSRLDLRLSNCLAKWMVYDVVDGEMVTVCTYGKKSYEY